jgi:hypothetical protein
VRGANLVAHLERHTLSPTALPITAASSATSEVCRGADRASRPALIVLVLVLWLAVGLAFALLGPLDDPAAWSLIAIGSLAFVPMMLSIFDVLPARIESDGTRLRLVWGAGLLTREVSLRGPIEVGRLRERRSAIGASSVDTHTGAEDVSAGHYLRIDDGRRHITVGASKGTGLRKHWAESALRAGPPRRRWDLQVDRPAMVALEYHLAALGLLTPRGE